MSRRNKAQRALVQPDPVYNSRLVTLLVSRILLEVNNFACSFVISLLAEIIDTKEKKEFGNLITRGSMSCCIAISLTQSLTDDGWEEALRIPLGGKSCSKIFIIKFTKSPMWIMLILNSFVPIIPILRNLIILLSLRNKPPLDLPAITPGIRWVTGPR